MKAILTSCAKVVFVVAVSVVAIPLMLSLYGLVAVADYRMARRHSR